MSSAIQAALRTHEAKISSCFLVLRRMRQAEDLLTRPRGRAQVRLAAQAQTRRPATLALIRRELASIAGELSCPALFERLESLSRRAEDWRAPITGRRPAPAACGACGRILAAAEALLLQRGAELMACPGCSRLLVVEGPVLAQE